MVQQQITLLGCGKMGSAMLEGWLADTSLDANFTIIEPHQTHLGWLKQRLGGDAIVIRAMPNTPAAIGKGITALYADVSKQVPNQARDLASQLLAAVGQVVHVQDEALMDGVTALSGSGPAYVFLLVEAMTEAGIKAGLPDDLAGELAKATVCGAGALMAAVDTAPAILRENVTSKGGTTAAALAVLMADGRLSSLMTKAVAAAKARSIELGE